MAPGRSDQEIRRYRNPASSRWNQIIAIHSHLQQESEGRIGLLSRHQGSLGDICRCDHFLPIAGSKGKPARQWFKSQEMLSPAFRIHDRNMGAPETGRGFPLPRRIGLCFARHWRTFVRICQRCQRQFHSDPSRCQRHFELAATVGYTDIEDRTGRSPRPVSPHLWREAA